MPDIRVVAPPAPVACRPQNVFREKSQQFSALSGCRGYSPGAVPEPPPIPDSHSP